MNLRTRVGAVRRQVLGHFLSRCVSARDVGPIISFTFDDFPRTAYTVGGSILKEFGARGTYYVAPGLMNKVNALGQQYHSEDLRSLVEQGHELGSHTLNHLSCTAVPLSIFREDVKKGRQVICEQAGVADSGNFAYPYGAVTLRAKRTLGLEMVSCRGTTGGVNGPEVDLNLLRANSLYGDVDQLEAIHRLIVENEKRRGWLIFYSHDVRPQPSRYGCSPALLEATVSFAMQRGATIVTVAQALAKIQGRPNHQ
jgi:peptidoglycan/xylan/chitin deacetylase (PgdA/CDA1 family)